MIFRRRLIYVQVHQDHFIARVIGVGPTIRRQCYALNNKNRPIGNFDQIRLSLKSIFKELAPGFSLRRPQALLHFIPDQYAVTQSELKGFKKAAERAGVSMCWMSKWATPHTDQELLSVFKAL